jgi:hypothetical protein
VNAARVGAGILMLLLGACAHAPPAPGTPAASGAPAADDELILVTVDNPQERPPLRAGSTLRGYDAAVSYGASSRARSTAAALAAQYDLREVAAWPIAPLGVHCIVFAVSRHSLRESVLSALSQDRRVRLAQPMQSFKTLAASYNDPYVGLQHGLAAIDAPGAQQWSRGEGVRVAVIDTGVDTGHKDLAGRVALARNFVDGDARQFAQDRHGTAVAGIISSVADNHEGIVGVAPSAQLLVVKACWQTGDGEAYCNSFTLAQALTAAIEAGARVVNLSLGGPADPLLDQLVRQSLARGIVVVGAVPPGGALDGFPLGTPGVIAVDVAGDDTARTNVLHAPGRDVITLAPGGHYDFVSGSSLAAAHVSGAAALLLADHPALSSAQVAALLADDPATMAGVNVCAALRTLRTLRSDGACGANVRGRPER